ncbi:S-phase kinase-associated protein 1A [Aphelenchoides avenae]|nr:S-phase kinase-associated protein 1A [Aphelenchus avenae]
MGSYLSKSALTPTSRQVICETSDKQHVAVDLDVLRASGTFDRMYRDLGLQEDDTFPGVFPLENVDSRVFKKVIQWCTAHKDHPFIVEKDPFTQECIWFQFNKYERRFFNVSVEEQLELVMAALYLDIPSLKHYACQAIASRIHCKQPDDVRRILRQRDDLSPRECANIRAMNPWLGSKASAQWRKATVSVTLHIPSEVLVAIFEKLSRADLERLQLVNTQFRNIILTVGKLGEEHGPLRRLHMVKIACLSSGGHRKGEIGFFGRAAIRSIFMKARKFFYGKYRYEPLHQLLPAKMAWKNAAVYASPDAFSSEEKFTFAFSELFLCKRILLEDFALGGAVPTSFLRLPAMVECNELDIGHLPEWAGHGSRINWIKVHDIVEWLEREDRKKWGAPRRLTIAGHAITDGPHELIEALKKVFLAASRPNPYVVGIRMLEAVDVDEQYHENKATHEELHVHKDEDGDCGLLVERKSLCTA